MTRVAILGGGPAGVGAAFKLRERDLAEVILLECQSRVGGNAGSFERSGHVLDYGSHRLHPACDAEILRDISDGLGADLLDRPRHGRIRLRGKWIRFPLRPIDLLLHLDRGFAGSSMTDLLRKPFSGPSKAPGSFASVLEAGLGPTICREFYFPYARKIWGLEPDELSPTQAHRRVSSSSMLGLLRKLLPRGLDRSGVRRGRYFYPRGGFGRISEIYAERAEELGAEIGLGRTVTRISRSGGAWEIETTGGDEGRTFVADLVWSTLPLTVLVSAMAELAPREVIAASKSIRYRAMILVYLELEVDRFTEFDAHYFPGPEISITRLSEPKAYADRSRPEGRTVICAELPCDRGDSTWNLGDDELGRRVAEDLVRSGLPVPALRPTVWSRRLPQAYPIYERGYEAAFETLDCWTDEIPGFLSYGRQGLFAHDNTHHALSMAYAAVDCLGPEGFDEDRWRQYRKSFAAHVVED